MESLKLTIDQLKNYLGTGLKVVFDHDTNTDFDLVGLSIEDRGIQLVNQLGDFGTSDLDSVRPKVFRLSDLDKFIPELGFVAWGELEKIGYHKHIIYDLMIGTPLTAPFYLIKKLFQWHFWPFGDEYFEAGLVIDKLKEKP